MRKTETYDRCTLLMALPFLPHELIAPMFRRISDQKVGDRMRQVITYMDSQWMQNSTFPVTAWSVYQRPFRTNNDVEGWHNRFNLATNSAGLNFYKLVGCLYDEAVTVQYVRRFVSQGLLSRKQKKIYVRLHGRMMSLWDTFSEGNLTAKQLLSKCAKLNAPSIKLK